MSDLEEKIQNGAVIEDKMLEPLADYVVVVPMNWETKGGIILVDGKSGDQPPTLFGRVVAKGPDCKTLSVGDVGLWGPYPKIVFGKGSQKFLLMKEAEIIALIKSVPGAQEHGDPVMN